jgi:hypothetical protein
VILVSFDSVLPIKTTPESQTESVRQGVRVLEFVLHHGRGVIGGVDHQLFVQDARSKDPANGQLQPPS